MSGTALIPREMPKRPEEILFCGTTELLKSDYNVLVKLFINPEESYKQDNSGIIRIKNKRVTFLNLGSIYDARINLEIEKLDSLQYLYFDFYNAQRYEKQNEKDFANSMALIERLNKKGVLGSYKQYLKK
jgi:hypothetical protein